MKRLFLSLIIALFVNAAFAQTISPLSGSGGGIGPLTPTTCTDTTILFADAGFVGCETDLTFNKITNVLTVIGQFTGGAGVSSAPPFYFGAANTGFYGIGTNNVSVSILGTETYRFGSGGLFATPSVGLGSAAAANTRLEADAADTLALRRTTNAQTFRVYNTFTDASNYERLNIDFTTTANTATVQTVAAGTGSVRNLVLRGGPTAPGTILLSNSFVTVSPLLGLAATSGGVTTLTIYAPSNGILRISNASQTDFSLLRLGGDTSSFPAIKRQGTGLDIRLADDSSYSTLTMSSATMTTGTITASTPALSIAQTWNNVATTFDAISVNVTNTASASTSNLIRLAIGGVDQFRVFRDGNGAVISGSSGQFTLAASATSVAYISTANGVGALKFSLGASVSAPDIFLERDAANTLALRNSTNPQTFRIYNTFTDASNYERGFVSWVSNDFTIGVEVAGTGSAGRQIHIRSAGPTRFFVNGTERWQISSSGHWITQADNTYDIGTVASNRPRTGYFGTSVQISATTVDSLSTCNAAAIGQRKSVTDATATTFASTVAGGGANIVPVFCNGTNWIIGQIKDQLKNLFASNDNIVLERKVA